MHKIHLMHLIVACSLAGSPGVFAQARQVEPQAQQEIATSREDIFDQTAVAPQTPRSPDGMKGIIERIFHREKEEQEIIASYAPVIETYIQVEKSNPLMGTVPNNDYYFLGLADFRGKTMKVHSMTDRTPKGSILWSFEPSGFLQMLRFRRRKSTEGERRTIRWTYLGRRPGAHNRSNERKLYTGQTILHEAFRRRILRAF
jgi:hypothetical protein